MVASEQVASGPAGWLEVTVPSAGGGAAPEVFFAARRLTSSVAWTVLSRPRLLIQGALPRLSLTILLSRVPHPFEESIRPLITGGLFNAAVTLALRPSEQSELGRELSSPVSGAFARTAVVEWLDADGSCIVDAPAHGLDPTGVLSVSLDAEHTAALTDALSGDSEASAGVVQFALRLPNQTPSTQVRLSLEPERVVAVLRGEATGEPRRLSVEAAEAVLASLLLDETIAGARDQPTPVVTALAGDLRKRLSDLLEPDLADRATVAVGPGPTSLPNQVVVDISAGRGTQDVVLQRAMGDLIAPAHADRDRLVRLLAPAADGSLQPVPPRTARSRSVAPATVRLAERGGRSVSLALAMTPDLAVKPSAAQLVASDVVQPLAQTAKVKWHGAQDFVLIAPHDSVPGGPEVSDPTAPTYPDHADPSVSWAAPAFTVVSATADANPAESPFLFWFSQQGMGGPGSLRPGLDASIRITVAIAAPPAGATPIDAVDTSALLLIPFRDSTSGVTTLQTVAGDVTPRDGTLRVDINLADDVARLAYGALAYPGFQGQPAQLKLATSFRAWVAVPPDRFHLAIGSKISTVNIGRLQTETPVESVPLFDPAALEIAQGGLRLKLVPDGDGALRQRGVVAFARSRLLSGRDVEQRGRRLPAAMIAVHPHLVMDQAAGERLNAAYALQTIVREQTIDVLFPCSELGGLYRQETDQGEQAIGCQDVLRLGEIRYRLYEEVTALRSDGYQVHRSLSQPGRFLLLATRYRITRYGPTEPADRAYRPAAMLYGLLQPDPAQNRYYLTATLDPDIAPFERAALVERLRPLCPQGVNPVLDLPTDPVCGATRSYSWVLPAGFEQPEVLQMQNGFQVSVSIGLDNAILLTKLIESSGLHGNVTFALPDGTSLTSELTLDTVVSGPFLQGPVALHSTGDSTEVGNPTERALDVLELRDGATVVPVNQTLAPGAKTTVATATGNGAVAVFAMHTDSMTVAQVGVFVEDVTADVVFVNLISLSDHDLAGVEVHCHLQGQAQVYSASLAEGQSATVRLTLPLDSYLQDQVLLFQIAATPRQGAPTLTPWSSWDLAKQGCVMSLTWEAIASETTT